MDGQVLNVWNIEEQLLQSRVIKLYGNCDMRMAQWVTSCIDVLEFDSTEEIKLEINTPGGDVLACLAICDKIKSSSCNIIGFCAGHCCSMGTAIAACCDRVYAYPNAQFMIHEISSGCQGKFREMKNSIEFDEALNHRLMTIIGAKCGKTYDEIMESCSYDLWMNSEEAKTYGLVDAIVSDGEKNAKSLKEFIKRIENK